VLPSNANYQEISRFFIDGYFFIPLAIFGLSFLITSSLSSGLFMWLGDLKNQKLARKISKFQIEKNDLVEGIAAIEEVSQKIIIIDLTKDKLMELYKMLKPNFNKSDLSKARAKLDSGKDILSANFALTFRALLAVSIYYATLPAFGIYLFILCCFVMLNCLVILIVAYKILDILPRIMQRAIEADNIYNNNRISQK